MGGSRDNGLTTGGDDVAVTGMVASTKDMVSVVTLSSLRCHGMDGCSGGVWCYGGCAIVGEPAINVSTVGYID